jgi:hypothetical protein
LPQKEQLTFDGGGGGAPPGVALRAMRPRPPAAGR